jgi:hypothetical protein
MLVFSSACLFCAPAKAVVFIKDLAPGVNQPGAPPVGTNGFLENFNSGGTAPPANHLANFSDLARLCWAWLPRLSASRCQRGKSVHFDSQSIDANV